LPIPNPEYDEAERIGSQLHVIDTKIDLIARRKDTLADLFRTLLHQLMTTQIRVDNLDLSELLALKN
jgi:type I restriction enzyme S subunit